MTKHDLKEMRNLGAELGAAKAENERLRAEVEALRVALLGIASANPAACGIEWAKAYASDGLSGTGSELYIRWLETFKEAEALRKDAERHATLSKQAEPTDTFTAVDMATAAAQGFRDGQKAEQAPAPDELWAVHAQGPDELYAAFSREDAEQHASALNALSMPAGIQVSAIVVESPWPAAEHWKYLAEQEREHAAELKSIAARPAQTEQQPEQSGLASAEWIEHGPSKPCPFHNPYLSKVDIRLRDGAEKFGELACNHTWFWYEHSQAIYDIVAYRPAISTQGSSKP